MQKIEEVKSKLPTVICGKVTSGKQLGREMGFPTANQDMDECADIGFGIYASTVEIDGISYHAVSNIGVRPTVEGRGANCESHIFDFSGDIYGKEIKTTLLAHLRDERKFSSVEELRLQIALDAECARNYFAEQNKD